MVGDVGLDERLSGRKSLCHERPTDFLDWTTSLKCLRD